MTSSASLSQPGEAPPPKRRRARRLSARAVRRTITIGQCWQAPDGERWVVENIRRHDSLAWMTGPAARFVSFHELGQRWQLVDDQEAG